MTKTTELKVEMLRYGDTGEALAAYLGITHPTFSNKLNCKAEFTQSEILAIQKRYGLSPERVNEIFFN